MQTDLIRVSLEKLKMNFTNDFSTKVKCSKFGMWKKYYGLTNFVIMVLQYSTINYPRL